MKFGKLLASSCEGRPEQEQSFLRYKLLKKQLKALKAAQESKCVATADTRGPQEEAVSSNCAPQETSGSPTRGSEEFSDATEDCTEAPAAVCPEEVVFIHTLNEDLRKFNDFFMEQEEDCVIKLKALEDRINSADSACKCNAIRAELVDLHGEMVLLVHWSMLNYAALMKILKKHDKVTGSSLRGPYLSNVLQQPFYSTEGITKLIRIAEELVRKLVAREESAAKGGSPQSSGDLDAQCAAEAVMLQRTQAALGMWIEMGRKAATPSTVFLNPSLLGSAVHALPADEDEDLSELQPPSKRMRIESPAITA